jgi:hypothetical protein
VGSSQTGKIVKPVYGLSDLEILTLKKVAFMLLALFAMIMNG